MTGLLVALLVVSLGLVVPLGVRLLALPLTAPVAAWLAAGAVASVSVLLDAGRVAVLLALPMVALCAGTAAVGLRRVSEGVDARVAAAVSASSSLGVVAVALLVDRSGIAPFLGFDATVWRLTVLHFCVAGFAASLLVGLTHVAAATRATCFACWAAPTGTALVAAGHFLGPWLELAGALSLTAGLLACSWAALHLVRLDEAGGQLLAVAAAVTPLTMLLAVSWALGHATDLPHLTLTQTAATHGVGNALGVGLAGVLGWTTVTKEQL